PLAAGHPAVPPRPPGARGPHRRDVPPPSGAVRGRQRLPRRRPQRLRRAGRRPGGAGGGGGTFSPLPRNGGGGGGGGGGSTPPERGLSPLTPEAGERGKRRHGSRSTATRTWVGRCGLPWYDHVYSPSVVVRRKSVIAFLPRS